MKKNNPSRENKLPCGCPKPDEWAMCVNQAHVGRENKWQEEFKKRFVRNPAHDYWIVAADPEEVEAFIAKEIEKAYKKGFEDAKKRT